MREDPGKVAMIHDPTITTKIKAEDFRRRIVKGMAISVNAFEGQVTLTGAADTPQRSSGRESSQEALSVEQVNHLLNIRTGRSNL